MAADTPAAPVASIDASVTDAVIDICQLGTRFGSKVIHQDLDLVVRRAEIFAVIGGSGSGKSTLLREMILLHRPDAGVIRILGMDIHHLNTRDALALRQRWGVMFQHGGLFGALTVLENVGLPLREHTDLPNALIDEIAHWKLALAGLNPAVVGAQYPAQLSGGMLKRASLARALALDPELLFLDEPTAGLDPVSAAGVDQLVRELRDLFGLTIVMITHDLDLLRQTADRVAVLAQGKVQATGSMDELSRLANPAIRPFFDGPRGRAGVVSQQVSSTPEVAPSKPK